LVWSLDRSISRSVARAVARAVAQAVVRATERLIDRSSNRTDRPECLIVEFFFFCFFLFFCVGSSVRRSTLRPSSPVARCSSAALHRLSYVPYVRKYYFFIFSLHTCVCRDILRELNYFDGDDIEQVCENRNLSDVYNQQSVIHINSIYLLID